MTLVLGLWAQGCKPPTGDDHGAIEVTGYLDGARVALVPLDGDVTAMGQDGAATPAAEVVLEDATTGLSVTGSVGAQGGFALSVAAVPGDQVAVRVTGASDHDALTVDLPDPDPFPTFTHALAYVDPADADRAVVEVRFDPGRLDGAVWAADPEVGVVGVLSPFDAGALHGGALVGAGTHDEVVLSWVVAGVASEGTTVTVTATPP